MSGLIAYQPIQVTFQSMRLTYRHIWQKIFLFTGIVFCLNVQGVTTSITTITIPTSTPTNGDKFNDYFLNLLHLALQKTESTHGECRLQEHSIWFNDKRRINALVEGKLDVIWSSTSAEHETLIQPIKISLLKDLTNYRLLLIRKQDQAIFSRINRLEDLQKLKGGMNPQWRDAAIMKANHLPMVFSVHYPSFFKMLAAKRFDYFSRGLYQIQAEANLFPTLNLAVEEHLILHYPNEFYFFVNKKNNLLAERIEQGLTIALADGSFDSLFNSVPQYRWGMEQLANPSRVVIDLVAPKK
ncbi:MAG: hypothetical protein V4732_09945 [Pseudomonadota bacterium]